MQTVRRQSLLTQKRRRKRKIWPLSSVLRIPATAAVSRAAVRLSSILRVRARDSREAVRRRERARDSRGTVRHRQDARDSREPVRYREPVPQARDVRQGTVRCVRKELHRAGHVRLPARARQVRSVRQERAGCQENGRYVQRDRHRPRARQARADRQETARYGQRDRFRATVRRAQTDRQETVLSVRTARDREGPREKAVPQETGRHAPIGRHVLTVPREAVLSAMEEGALTEETEAKEAAGTRDRTDPDRAATAGIPAGTMWAHRW